MRTNAKLAAVLAMMMMVGIAAPAIAQDDEGHTPPPPPAPRTEARAAPGDSGGEEAARARAYHDENMAKGDYYFKAGYYLKASEAYRVAVLNEPSNPWKKLAFGHALFAIGNYSYASYALRRAIASVDPSMPFNPDVTSLFPSRKTFDKAVRDLKRYVTYSPRDPAGLSVLGYMLYASGEDDRAREMFQYLQKLPSNGNDPFAQFFLKQIDTRKAVASGTPQPVEPPRVEVAPPPKTLVAPPPPPKTQAAASPVAPPEAGRLEEDPAQHPIKPTPAVAE